MGRIGRKHPIQKRAVHVVSHEKIKRWKYLIVGVVVVLVGLGVMMQSMSKGATATEGEMHTKTEPAIEKALAKGTQIVTQVASVEADASIGVEGVSLDFASETHVIFHDYFGLFVYDLQEQKIVTSLNLESIDCQWMQGDNACEVIVNKEGNMILLHPMMSEEMFVYDLKEHTLIQTKFVTFEEPFKLQENPHPSGVVSYQVVMLPDGKVSYLGYANGMVKDITYYIGDQEAYPIFKDFFEEVNYSVAYIPQSGNSMFLENIGEAQKAHIERLITQYMSTSFALSGRGIDELGDYYLIRYESEGEKEAYLIYQIEGEAYIQQSTYADLNQIGQCRKINWIDYEEITRWYQ